MKNIKEKIKNSKVLGFLYFYFFKLFYILLDIVTKTDSKKILFCSFSGKQISDSPLAIYNYLKNDDYFKNYKFYWINNDNKKTKIRNLRYYYLLFTSKYWVSNASIEGLISYNHKNHIYINTWHGIPLKKLGPDEANLNWLVKKWYRTVKFDLFTCNSDFDNVIFKKIFPSTHNFKICGLPRNEILLTNKFNSLNIRDKIGINTDKKIILYAPTFREFESNQLNYNIEQLIINLKDDYTILYRGHYFSNQLKSKDFIDVTNYSNLNELFAISDALITDYSSILFDFSLLEKPIYLFLFDWEKYSSYRGFYKKPTDLGLSYYFSIGKLKENIKIDLKDIENVKSIKKRYFSTNNYSNYIIKEFIKNN